MADALTIRPEKPQDRQAIFDLTRDAFAPKSIGAGKEAPATDTIHEDHP
jgi:predicted N-acetyltransferase YhbS